MTTPGVFSFKSDGWELVEVLDLMEGLQVLFGLCGALGAVLYRTAKWLGLLKTSTPVSHATGCFWVFIFPFTKVGLKRGTRYF